MLYRRYIEGIQKTNLDKILVDCFIKFKIQICGEKADFMNTFRRVAESASPMQSCIFTLPALTPDKFGKTSRCPIADATFSPYEWVLKVEKYFVNWNDKKGVEVTFAKGKVLQMRSCLISSFRPTNTSCPFLSHLVPYTWRLFFKLHLPGK